MAKPARPIKIVGNVAYIPLTMGKVAMIDAADVHLVGGHCWTALKHRRTFYAKRAYRVGGDHVTLLLHRVIMNASDDRQVDHEDGDGLNCRRSNMRLATHAQNKWNSKTPVNNVSGIKGVSRSGKRWRARIAVNNQRIEVYCATKEEAAAERLGLVKRHHGSFGRV